MHQESNVPHLGWGWNSWLSSEQEALGLIPQNPISPSAVVPGCSPGMWEMERDGGEAHTQPQVI